MFQNSQARYIFENVAGILEFPCVLEWIRRALPGTDGVRDVSADQGMHRVRYWRTNIEGARFHVPVGTLIVHLQEGGRGRSSYLEPPLPPRLGRVFGCS